MGKKTIKPKNPSSKELLRAKHVAAKRHDPKHLPPGAIWADHDKLDHINTYGELPPYYLDKPFACRDCGVEQIWTAKQQQWWHEEAKGHIDSFAVRCRACRRAQKHRDKT